MLFEPLLLHDLSKRVLHGHTIRSYHAIGVDVNDVNVVELLDKVSARDDLSGFVDWDFGECEGW